MRTHKGHKMRMLQLLLLADMIDVLC